MRKKNVFVPTALIIGASLLSSARAAAQNFNAWPVTHIAAGYRHSLFTKSDGSLWGMGDNTYGKLGLGPTLTNTAVPQRILTNNVRAIAAGENHSMVVQGSSLFTMGFNASGELGDGTTNNHFFPEQVYNGFVNKVRTISAGYQHSLFAENPDIGGSGALLGMGDNQAGDLGDGTFTVRRSPEVILSNSGPAVSAIAAGGSFSVFIKPDGSLWGMGVNTYGVLENAPFNGTNKPVLLVSSGVVAVSAGAAHILFIKSDGSLWAMGNNFHGQLGQEDGGYSNKSIPVRVGGNFDPVFDAVAVAAGNVHSLFIRADGSLWAFGDNSLGQLGDGGSGYPQRDTPEVIASNVVAVAAGFLHTLFIKSDGSLWGTGYNGYGQLGTGDYTDRHSPVLIVSPPPQLSILPYGANVILAWGTNAAGFKLQSTTNLAPPVVWNSVSETPVVIGSDYAVFTSISGPQKFYRLSQ